MTGPLVLACEAAVTLPQQHLDRVTRALVAALLRPGDELLYRVALQQVRTVPQDARWLLELAVEVELAANGVPFRHPSGIRW